MRPVFTFRRIANTLLAECSCLLGRMGVVRLLHHAPTFVSVEPADYCQLRCPQCPVGRGDGGRERGRQMSRALMHKVLEAVGSRAHTMQFYFQGEPLLNKDLPRLIRMAHDAGLYTVVSTNGQALDAAMARRLVAAGLDRLIVSMDGLTDASYSAYRRGGSLQRALDAMRLTAAARGARRHPLIEMQVLRLRSNQDEWGHMRRTYRTLGADRLVFKTAQFYDYADGNPLMPSDERYNRYRRDEKGRYYPKKSGGGYCRRMLTGCVITASGDVLPCCYDKQARYVFGNILSMDRPASEWDAVWHGAQAAAFRHRVFAGARDIPICHNCAR